MKWALLTVAAWFFLSLPIALIVGYSLRRRFS